MRRQKLVRPIAGAVPVASRGTAWARRLLAVLVWSALCSGDAAAAEEASPKVSSEVVRQRLDHELDLVRARNHVRSRVQAFDAQQRALGRAQAVLSYRGEDVARRLDAYNVSRSVREEQAGERARSLYRLARGGMLRLIFEDRAVQMDASASRPSRRDERIANARTMRWIVRRDLRELGVYQKAETVASEELLILTRERTAFNALQTFASVQRQSLRARSQEVERELSSAREQRRSLTRTRRLTEANRELLRKVGRERDGEGPPSGQQFLFPKALRRPVDGKIVGRFGAYSDPVLGIEMQRNGVEIEAHARQKVLAPAGGEVAFVGDVPGFQRAVVLDHGNGYRSMIARLLEVVVTKGQRLEQGAYIGRPAPEPAGSELGRTIYFELRHAQLPLDPISYLTRH